MRRIVRWLTVAGLAAAVVEVLRRLGGKPSPALSDDRWPADQPWPALQADPDAASDVATTPTPSPTTAEAPAQARPAVSASRPGHRRRTEPIRAQRRSSIPPSATRASSAVEASAGSGPWVDPGKDGSCPPSHPVKAKLASGIFHEEGMLNYERTNADRCYRDRAAAEADGLRAAKR